MPATRLAPSPFERASWSTYDRDTASVWVACYVGRILVFDDSR